ncbi:MAG: DUF308 domain-containing protein, partial [Parahaliea sp.]
GVLQVVIALRLRREVSGEWMLVLSGLLSVLFGVLMIAQPGAGILAVLWLIATYAVFFGLLSVVLAFRLRSFGQQTGAVA